MSYFVRLLNKTSFRITYPVVIMGSPLGLPLHPAPANLPISLWGIVKWGKKEPLKNLG